ncbi:MAG: HEAT repeat domain-containing protein [Gemmataceae bacterium]
MPRLWAVLVVAGVAAVGAGRADEPAPAVDIPVEQLAKARLLVRQLGSPSYQAREEASAELAKLGRAARPALLEAVAESPDYEVRARAARLLPRAEAADLQLRIDAFVADADGKKTHDLPGWDQFREQVGNDRPSRALFAELMKAPENREVLSAVGGSRREGGIAVGNRRLAVYLAEQPNAFGRVGFGPIPQPKQPTLADIATVLFGETVIPSADIPRAGPFTFINGAMFAQKPQSLQVATNPTGHAHGEAYKKLLLRWIDTRSSPEDLSQLVNTYPNLSQVKDMTPILRRAATADGVQGMSRGQSLTFLVQRNKKAEHPFLKAQLKNETLVGAVYLGQNPNGQPIQANCQLRDVALALLIAETGQNLHEYGFQSAPGANLNPVQNPYPTYAFLADEDRDRAQRKWAEWEAKHPIPVYDPGPPAKK